MLYDELIRIENMIEGNEYFAGGVSYFVGIDKLDSSLSLDLAVKIVCWSWMLLDHLKKTW